jgi:hypothetical protein
MRISTTSRGSLALGLLAALLFAGLPGSHGQQPSATNPLPKDKGKEAASAEKPSLEDLLAQALKDNPDIRVAEAKVNQAEAELNRTRLQVMQKVATFYSTRFAAQAKVTRAEKDLERVRRLLATSAISQEDYRATEQALIVAKADLEVIEAELPALLGKPPQTKASQENTAQVQGTNQLATKYLSLHLEQPHSSTALSLLALTEAYRQQAAAQAVPATVAEKLRKTLDMPIKVDFKDTPLDRVLDYLQERTGITIRYPALRMWKTGTITLKFAEPLSLRAVLQALEDELPPIGEAGSLRFVVRDYGLLMVPTASAPPGALFLDQFYRQATARAQTEAYLKNPPAQDVEGVVKKIDQTGLVTISIGSDAGLAKGHTLEIYRLNPAKYLGTVRILEVNPSESVGRLDSKATLAPVQVGDRAASRIQGN